MAKLTGVEATIVVHTDKGSLSFSIDGTAANVAGLSSLGPYLGERVDAEIAKLVGFDDLEAKIAKLEAANAELDAALTIAKAKADAAKAKPKVAKADKAIS